MTTIVNVYENKIAAIHRLRVNVKSLACEARLIRCEERRCGELYRQELRLHRIGRLREEARYAQLALAYARHQPYNRSEAAGSKPVDATRLEKKIRNFGGNGDVIAWLAAG